MTTSSVCTSPSRTWGWRPCTRRGTLTTTSSTSRLGITLKRTKHPSLILPGQKNLCWDLWGSSQGPCLRGAMAWRQVRSQENLKSMFSLALYPVPMSHHLILLLQVRSHAVEGALEFPFGATLKPIIVYIVSPQTFSTCLILLKATSFLSFWASCQTISLNKNTWVTIRMSDRLRTHLIHCRDRGGSWCREFPEDLTDKKTTW